MSILDGIKAQCRWGRLHPLEHSLPWATEVRSIWVSPELRRLLEDGPWEDEAQEERWGKLHADLDFFIEGGVIQVAVNSQRGGDAYMTRLIPPEDEVWEIRSRDPEPSIRVFGRFARKNAFVALNWDERKDLGAFGSREWRDAMVRCGAEWRNLFPSYNALSGRNYPYDYITLCVPV